MNKLISSEEAAKLVAGSEERKNELISDMNRHIESQSKNGLRWAHLPANAIDVEKDWLRDELVLAGFTVKLGDPAITW